MNSPRRRYTGTQSACADINGKGLSYEESPQYLALGTWH